MDLTLNYLVGAGSYGTNIGTSMLGQPTVFKKMANNENAKRESLALRMLNRAGIPRFYSATMRRDGSCEIIMELMKGTTLRHLSEKIWEEYFLTKETNIITEIFI